MRRLTLAAAIAALPTLAISTLALAQPAPDSPENLVVTATRVPSQAAQLPAGITIITRKTIEERGYTTLVDALSAVPGLRVVQSGGPGAQTSLFIRGTNSNHVLVLRDGVPINDPGDPGGAFNFGIDTLEDIERIEIIRGPMSATYGSGAIGGVINLISRHGKGAPHGHIVLAAGLPRQGLAQGDIAGSTGIWDYAASLEGLSLLGFDQTPRREAPVYTGERDGDRAKQAQLELGVTPATDTRLSLLLRARDAKYGYDEVGFVAFDGPNATGYDASLYGRLGLTSKLLQGAWETSLTLTRLQNDRAYIIALDAADPNQASGNSHYHGRRTDTQWNNTLHLPDTGPLTTTSLTLGYQQISDQSDTAINTSSDGYPYLSTVRAHDDTQSGYAGLQTHLLQRLALQGQLREDATTIAGSALTWRTGAVLDIPEIWSHLKAATGTSFRAPALYDRYGIDSYGYVGNPHLQPEYARSTEFGVTTDLPIAGNAKAASLSLTYFSNHIHNLIETVYAPDYLSSTSVNIDRARTKGLEATLTLQVANFLQSDLTYTYTDARDLTTGAVLLRRPYNQGAANLRVSPIPPLTITPELIYTGSFQDYLTDNTGTPLPYTGLSPSGLIFNLNATYTLTPHITLFAWGKNLANSRFEPVNGYQTPGPSLMAGLRYTF